MTVSTEISSNEYTGNGVTTDFDYKFRIFKENQLSVITSDADGDNVLTLRLGTDYTVTGANKSAGGKVILNKPLANGHKISIARDIPITQETSFRNQSKFFAETHENAFDYLTMILQSIWGSLGSLYLKRPNILANWFDAKGYRIANLGKPKRDSDAVDLGTLKDEISGVNSTILKKEKRTLRVDDMDIPEFPSARYRRNKQVGFDELGKPILLDPAETGSLGYIILGTFEKGATLTSRYQALFWERENKSFRWDGSLPKVVPADSTPQLTGGIGEGAWVPVETSANGLNFYGYSLAFYAITTKKELVRHEGYYYKTLSESYPVTDLSDFQNTEKWVNMGKLDGHGITDAMNFSSENTCITSGEFRLLVLCANYLNKDITNNNQLTAELIGNDDIVIRNGMLWNNSRINISGFGGKVIFQRPSENIITHNSDSEIVKAIKEGTIVGNIASGLRGTTVLDDSMIIINTKSPYYIYRSNVVNRTEINYHTRDGYLLSSLKYPINVVDITTVHQLKASRRIIPVGGIEFYIGDKEAGQFVIFKNSKMYVTNITFTQDNKRYSEGNPTLFHIDECDHFYGENITTQWSTDSTVGTGWTYFMSMGRSFNVHLKGLSGIGDGWGSTASNDSTQVIFENCKLSCIDFHKPVTDYLKIIDCTIGHFGVMVTAIGDLYLIRPKFICDKLPWRYDIGLIRSRDDTGGWCDANLYVEKAKIINTDGTEIKLLKARDAGNGGVPSDSPLNFTFFNKVVIDGIDFYGKSLDLAPDLPAGSKLKLPSILSYNSITGDPKTERIRFYLDLDYKVPAFTSTNGIKNFNLSISNSELNSFWLIDHSGLFDSKVTASNVTGLKNSIQPRTLMTIPFQGEIDLNGCNISNLDFYAKQSQNKRVYVKLFGGTLYHTQDAARPDSVVNAQVKGLAFIRAYGTTFISHKTSSLSSLTSVFCDNCIFRTINNDGSFTSYDIPILTSFSNNSASLINANTLWGQKYKVSTGLDQDGTYQEIDIYLPKTNRSSSFQTMSGVIEIKNINGVFSSNYSGRISAVVMKSIDID